MGRARRGRPHVDRRSTKPPGHHLRPAPAHRQWLLRPSARLHAKPGRFGRARRPVRHRVLQLPHLRTVARQPGHRPLRARTGRVGQRRALHRGSDPAGATASSSTETRSRPSASCTFRRPDDDSGFPDQRIPMHVKQGVGDLYGSLRPDVPRQRNYLNTAANPRVGESEYMRYDAAITRKATDWLATEAPQHSPLRGACGFPTRCRTRRSWRRRRIWPGIRWRTWNSLSISGPPTGRVTRTSTSSANSASSRPTKNSTRQSSGAPSPPTWPCAPT